MNRLRRTRKAGSSEDSSLTIQQGFLMVVIFGAATLTLNLTLQAQPSWWNSTGAVNSSLATNDYASANQGQVKQFTQKADQYMDTNLAIGAATNLDSLVAGWSNYYVANGYTSTNPAPKDFQVVNQGQLKYIGSLVWNDLFTAGFTNNIPSWITVNPTSDYKVANLGQVKTVFNFDLSSFASVPHITSSSTASGTAGTAFSYTITASATVTTYGATGLPPWLSINTSSGVISGTPPSTGLDVLMLSASNSFGTGYMMLTLTVNPSLSVPVITSGTTASGVNGTPFTYVITANNAPTSFSATGLPSGLGVNTNTGVIMGTPTSSGTSTVVLGASNSGGTGTGSLTLSISNPPAPVITSSTAVSGALNAPFVYTITASNNPTNFTTTSLPAGLNVNSSSGVISGTPTATGTSTVTLSAINAGGTGTATLALTINGTGAPVITSGLTAIAVNSVPFTYTITANNSPTSFNATNLPMGLNVTPTTGAITGTPTVTSTSSIFSTIYAINSSGTGSATLLFTMNPPAPVISSATSASGSVGSAFGFSVIASNNPTLFTATGLPSGLSINPSTGVIMGTPTGSMTSTVSLAATNAGGTGTGSLTLSFTNSYPVPVISSSTLASGDSGVSFNYFITTSTLPAPTNYSATGLPSGLSLNTGTGTITGSTTLTGTYAVTLSASNASGTGTAILNLTINSTSAPILTGTTTVSGTLGTAFSFPITASGSVTAYSATGLPPGLSLVSGTISGTPIILGTSSPTITASNTYGASSQILNLTINPPPPVITSSTTATGTFGVALNPPYSITASNNPTNFAASTLPPGLFLNTVTGSITGTPAITGSWTVTISGTNAGGSGSANLVYTVGGGLSQPITTRSVAAGDYHTLLLKSDGTVWAKGLNGSGQLGNGGRASSDSYVQVSGLANIVSIAAEGSSSLALRNDGTVWAWGLNGNHQLGDNTITNRFKPIQVQISGGTYLNGIIAISGGEGFGMALTGTGGIWAWGENYNGQIGYSGGTDSSYAVPISSLSGVVAIACGGYHALAIKNDGSLWTWGSNNSGELGIGSSGTVNVYTPYQVPGLAGLIAISGGGGTYASDYSVAVKNDGTVWSWGDNYYGQLGNGTVSGTITTPVQISNLTGITSVSSGHGGHALALKSDGTAWAWGDNGNGQLGNGTTNASYVPIQVSNLTGVTAMAVGVSHNVAIKSDGTIWGWGLNTDGEVGTAGPATQTATPTIVPGLTGTIIAISARKSHALALKSDGTVWTWNDTTPGQISDGVTVTGSSLPIQITGLSNIIAVASGGYHNLALRNDGTVWSWGLNNYGQLGNGTTPLAQIPQQVTGITGTVTAIACSSYSSLALDSTGYVWTWGHNSNGELGNGTTANSSVPAHISYSTLSGSATLAAGAYHSLASTSGNVLSWGYNLDGELGTGYTTNSPTPTSIPSFSVVTQFAGGYRHSTALKSDGSVWMWGANDDGELGTNFPTGATSPAPISILTGMTNIASGGDSFHVAALKSDHTVWTWGSNNNGQLGVGLYGTVDGTSPTGSTSPVQVVGLSGTVTALALGEYSTYALRSDGTVLQWGDTSYEPFAFSVPVEMGDLSVTPAPTISPAGGSYSTTQTIRLSTTLTGTIFYTLDGSQPTTTSLAIAGSTGTFSLSGSALVSAQVFSGGAPISPVASTQFYIADSGHTGLPTAATGLSLTATSTSTINLNWTLSGLTNYNSVVVYRSVNGGTYQLLDVLSPAATSYQDTNVQSGSSYGYYIGTLNSSGESNSSTSSTSPFTTTNLIITVTAPSGATNLP
jgi:alpha-tubulin suppressor-like RCC1 family protein